MPLDADAFARLLAVLLELGLQRLLKKPSELSPDQARIQGGGQGGPGPPANFLGRKRGKGGPQCFFGPKG